MKYSRSDKEKVLDEICYKISEGESLREIFKKPRPKNFPDRTVFYDWLRENEDFHNRYARAMELRVLLFVDEIIEISDDSANDTLTIQKGKQSFDIKNKEWVNRSRLRVDSRKWLACKFFPKQFGDKVWEKDDEKGDNEIIIRRV